MSHNQFSMGTEKKDGVQWSTAQFGPSSKYAADKHPACLCGAYPKSTTRERNQEKLQFGLPNPLLKALLQLHTNAKASNPCLINVNNWLSEPRRAKAYSNPK